MKAFFVTMSRVISTHRHYSTFGMIKSHNFPVLTKYIFFLFENKDP